MDFLYQLNDFTGLFFEYYIYPGLLGAVIVASLIQGKAAKNLLWIAAILLGYSALLRLMLFLFPPGQEGSSLEIVLLFSFTHIAFKALLIGVCATALKRQARFHLKLALAMSIIMLLVNLSYILEMFLPVSSGNFYAHVPLMTLLDLLILLPLIGGVISGFIKPKYQLKTVHEQEGVSQ